MTIAANELAGVVLETVCSRPLLGVGLHGRAQERERVQLAERDRWPSRRDAAAGELLSLLDRRGSGKRDSEPLLHDCGGHGRHPVPTAGSGVAVAADVPRWSRKVRRAHSVARSPATCSPWRADLGLPERGRSDAANGRPPERRLVRGKLRPERFALLAIVWDRRLQDRQPARRRSVRALNVALPVEVDSVAALRVGHGVDTEERLRLNQREYLASSHACERPAGRTANRAAHRGAARTPGTPSRHPDHKRDGSQANADRQRPHPSPTAV